MALAMAAALMAAVASQSLVMRAAEAQGSAVVPAGVVFVEEISVQEMEEAAAEQTVTEEQPAEEELVEEVQAESLQTEEIQETQEVQAEEASGQVVESSAGGYETELLAALIFCEAGNQSFQGQVAVGAVVLNRMASSAYPNTMEEVIYQSGQFGPACSGWLDQVRKNSGYTESALQAAQAALAGENPIGSCLYFDQGGYGIQIGAHYFH